MAGDAAGKSPVPQGDAEDFHSVGSGAYDLGEIREDQVSLFGGSLEILKAARWQDVSVAVATPSIVKLADDALVRTIEFVSLEQTPDGDSWNWDKPHEPRPDDRYRVECYVAKVRVPRDLPRYLGLGRRDRYALIDGEGQRHVARGLDLRWFNARQSSSGIAEVLLAVVVPKWPGTSAPRAIVMPVPCGVVKERIDLGSMMEIHR
jgi:hypothetical protein